MTGLERATALFQRLKMRKRRSWDEVPTFIIFLLAIASWAEAGFYGCVLKKFGPDYVDLANQPGAMSNIPFLVAGGLLLLIGVQLFIWGFAAKNLTAVLEKRVWPK